jgi:maltose O-acetyltransferase
MRWPRRYPPPLAGRLASDKNIGIPNCRLMPKRELEPMQDPPINRLLRYPTSALSRLRRIRYRMLGAHIGRGCTIRRICIPRNPWDIYVDDYACLENGVVLLATGERTDQPRVFIGHGSYINRYTMIDAHQRIEIGRHCMIGPFCYLTDGDHRSAPGEPPLRQPIESAPVKLADDVWIGAHVCILKGVTIGQGAVVGAGAVVTHDVPAFARVVGVPARPIGS